MCTCVPKTERNRSTENEYNIANFEIVIIFSGQNKDKCLIFPFISFDFMFWIFLVFFFPEYLWSKLILSGHVICFILLTAKVKILKLSQSSHLYVFIFFIIFFIFLLVLKSVFNRMVFSLLDN